MRSLLVAAVALLVPVAASGASGKVTFLEGPATRLAKGTTEAAALAVDGEVSDGDVVETGPKGRVEITLADDSVVRLNESSKLVVDSVTKVEQSWNVKLTLTLGEIWSKVTRKVGPDAGYEIQTERAVAGVRGTEFVVEAAGDHEIEVLEGKVEVAVRDGEGEGAGKKFQVAKGERLRVEKGMRCTGPAASKGERGFLKWVKGRDADRRDDRDRRSLKERREDSRQRRNDRRELRRERLRDLLQR